MRQRECDGGIGGPLMKCEQIHVSMRPEFHWAVAQGHEHAKPKIDSGGSDRSQTQIGALVKDADWQGQVDSMVAWINSENRSMEWQIVECSMRYSEPTQSRFSSATDFVQYRGEL